jgi:hypothetical protein
MARITVEDCLRNVESRFELVAAGKVKLRHPGDKEKESELSDNDS